MLKMRHQCAFRQIDLFLLETKSFFQNQQNKNNALTQSQLILLKFLKIISIISHCFDVRFAVFEVYLVASTSAKIYNVSVFNLSVAISCKQFNRSCSCSNTIDFNFRFSL